MRMANIHVSYVAILSFLNDRGLIHEYTLSSNFVNGSHKITHLHLILCDVNV